MEKALDCRGLACPAPVLQTRELIEKENPEQIMVSVDNEAARQNVTRLLESQNFEVTMAREGEAFVVAGKRDMSAAPGEVLYEEPASAKKKIMVMAATDRIGRGDDELGTKLMINFLKTLKEMGDELWRLVFVNNGVKMTVEGAEVLPILMELARDGVSILVCGTCLDHFNLLEKKKVGETTNMLDIVTAMQIADKVITL